MIDTLLAIIAALVGFIVFNAAQHTRKDNKRIQGEIDSLKESKKNYEDIQTLDDDRVISEFDRLHKDRRNG